MTVGSLALLFLPGERLEAMDMGRREHCDCNETTSSFSLRSTHCPVVAWAPDVLLGPCNQLLKVLRATGVRSQAREGEIFVAGKDVM